MRASPTHVGEIRKGIQAGEKDTERSSAGDHCSAPSGRHHILEKRRSAGAVTWINMVTEAYW